MELLTGTDSDALEFRIWRDHLCEIRDAHARNLGHEQLAALHPRERIENELHALGERNPEPGHPFVGDGNLARTFGDEALEERDHTATAAYDVPISYDGEAADASANVCISVHEQLVAHQLCRAVKVD